jgi:hypothetical protein
MLLLRKITAAVLAVAVLSCCFVTVSYAAISITDIPDDIVLFPGTNATNSPSHDPDTLDYDFVLFAWRYPPNIPGQVMMDIKVYFCKNGVVTKDSLGRWTTNGVMIPTSTAYLPVVDDFLDREASMDSDRFDMIKYYPDALGYLGNYEEAINPVNHGAIGNNTSGNPTVVSKYPPDPPVPPDPPPPPEPPPPEFPIPPHNPDMVPWEPDRVLGDLESRIKYAIEVAVNTGLIILGYILAIYVMIRIIKMFENTSGGDGG